MDLAKYMRYVMKTQKPSAWEHYHTDNTLFCRTLFTYRHVTFSEWSDGSFWATSIVHYDHNSMIKAFMDAKDNVESYTVIDERPPNMNGAYTCFRICPIYREYIEGVKYW